MAYKPSTTIVHDYLVSCLIVGGPVNNNHQALKRKNKEQEVDFKFHRDKEDELYHAAVC